MNPFVPHKRVCKTTVVKKTVIDICPPSKFRKLIDKSGVCLHSKPKKVTKALIVPKPKKPVDRIFDIDRTLKALSNGEPMGERNLTAGIAATLLGLGGLLNPVDLEAAKQHTVAKGDTIYKIAKDNNVPSKDLLAANPGIKNPNLIKIGQTLNIPDAKSKNLISDDDMFSGDWKTYTVSSSDKGLSTIAAKLKTTVAHIVKANGIKNPNFIKPGQKLKYKEVNKNPTSFEKPEGTLKFIVEGEGFSSKPYFFRKVNGKTTKVTNLKDWPKTGDGWWTVGYGSELPRITTTVKPEELAAWKKKYLKTYTKKECENMANGYIDRLVSIAQKNLKHKNLTDGQKIAMLSFGYNAGEGRMLKMIKDHINKDKLDDAVKYMKQFVNGRGVASGALKARRNKEIAKWNEK